MLCSPPRRRSHAYQPITGGRVDRRQSAAKCLNRSECDRGVMSSIGPFSKLRIPSVPLS